jgi:hypothetical protein
MVLGGLVVQESELPCLSCDFHGLIASLREEATLLAEKAISML